MAWERIPRIYTARGKYKRPTLHGDNYIGSIPHGKEYGGSTLHRKNTYDLYHMGKDMEGRHSMGIITEGPYHFEKNTKDLYFMWIIIEGLHCMGKNI